jgi:hypothetical protein
VETVSTVASASGSPVFSPPIMVVFVKTIRMTMGISTSNNAL